MAAVGRGINSLRSLAFVRQFGNQIIEKTDTRVRKESGNLELIGINPTSYPKENPFQFHKISR